MVKKISLILSFILGFILVSNVAFAEDTKASLAGLKTILDKYGRVKIEGTEKVGDKTVPGLYFGNRKINNNFDAVDEIKKKHGGTATIFVKDGKEFIRISTNVLKNDGKRAIGTLLAHNEAYMAVNNGETFCGDLVILGSAYSTCYEPIKNATGNIVGIYYVGYIK